jgi:hypothetical protein
MKNSINNDFALHDFKQDRHTPIRRRYSGNALASSLYRPSVLPRIGITRRQYVGRRPLGATPNLSRLACVFHFRIASYVCSWRPCRARLSLCFMDMINHPVTATYPSEHNKVSHVFPSIERPVRPVFSCMVPMCSVATSPHSRLSAPHPYREQSAIQFAIAHCSSSWEIRATARKMLPVPTARCHDGLL